MELRIQPRAEIQLRSLQANDRKQIEDTFRKLLAANKADLFETLHFQPLLTHASAKRLYSAGGSERLRLVFSIENSTCILEDVMDYERLEQLLQEEGQE